MKGFTELPEDEIEDAPGEEKTFRAMVPILRNAAPGMFFLRPPSLMRAVTSRSPLLFSWSALLLWKRDLDREARDWGGGGLDASCVVAGNLFVVPGTSAVPLD